MRLEVIVLAAGEGTRMQSSIPKVLNTVGGRPLLDHVLSVARDLKPDAYKQSKQSCYLRVMCVVTAYLLYNGSAS